MPVLAGKDSVKVGCSGVGALARFQSFPWIHLDTTHARPNGVMLTTTHLRVQWAGVLLLVTCQDAATFLLLSSGCILVVAKNCDWSVVTIENGLLLVLSITFFFGKSGKV